MGVFIGLFVKGYPLLNLWDDWHGVALNAFTLAEDGATPVSYTHLNGQSPVDLTAFPACKGVLDVVYNPCLLYTSCLRVSESSMIALQ